MQEMEQSLWQEGERHRLLHSPKTVPRAAEAGGERDEKPPRKVDDAANAMGALQLGGARAAGRESAQPSSEASQGDFLRQRRAQQRF